MLVDVSSSTVALRLSSFLHSLASCNLNCIITTGACSKITNIRKIWIDQLNAIALGVFFYVSTTKSTSFIIEWASIITMYIVKLNKNNKNHLWLRYPIQLLMKTQWWSNFYTHRLQKLQWSASSGLSVSQGMHT